MIKTIFEINNRKEVINRFLNHYSQGYTEFLCSLSSEYINGINALQEAMKDPAINKNKIEKASGYFAIAVKEDKGKNKLLAYLGQIVCFYIMDNLFAIKSLKQAIIVLEPRIPINIPTKLSLKGVSQNLLKSIGIATGGAISCIPPLKMAGVALTQASLRYQTEDAILNEKPFDTEFYQLRDEIISIEYEKLHRILK